MLLDLKDSKDRVETQGLLASVVTLGQWEQQALEAQQGSLVLAVILEVLGYKVKSDQEDSLDLKASVEK